MTEEHAGWWSLTREIVCANVGPTGREFTLLDKPAVAPCAQMRRATTTSKAVRKRTPRHLAPASRPDTMPLFGSRVAAGVLTAAIVALGRDARDDQTVFDPARHHRRGRPTQPVAGPALRRGHPLSTIGPASPTTARWSPIRAKRPAARPRTSGSSAIRPRPRTSGGATVNIPLEEHSFLINRQRAIDYLEHPRAPVLLRRLRRLGSEIPAQGARDLRTALPRPVHAHHADPSRPPTSWPTSASPTT